MHALRLIARTLAVVVVCAFASGAFAQDLQVRFVTYNVDFNNTAQQVDSDIQLLKSEADIMMFQEAKNVIIANSFGSLFTVYQVTDQGDAKQGSALAVRKSVGTVLATGLKLGVDNHGEEMLDRYIAWADVCLANGVVMRVMAMHMPPARFQYLQPIMADNLVAFVAQSPYPVIVGADWNYTVTNDPYNIQDRTGMVPKGVGIDGFHFAPNVLSFQSVAALTNLNTNSGHDAVQMIVNAHQPTYYVVDNAYGGFAAPSDWSTGSSAADKYGMDYRFKSQGTGSYATFTPNIVTTGSYELYEWHSQGANRTQEAPCIVNYDGGMDAVLVNQELNGGAWNSLGLFNFAAGKAGSVMVTDQIPEVSPEVVLADAVRFVYRGEPAPPAVPQGLAATAVSDSQIDLLWENVLNETGYVVARSAVSGGPYTSVATLAANVTSYSDTNLEDGVTYYYVVKGTNAAGASGNSAEANATTALNPPVAPSALSATVAGQTQITLTWTDNSGKEANFVVARGSATGGPYTDIATLAANTTSYSDTGLTANTTYYYVVRATNAGGASANSNAASALTWPSDIVVDNSGAGFTASANWKTGTSAADKYGVDYRFRDTAALSDLAQWTFSVPQARNYDIYAWWSQGTNRSTLAPYTLPDGATVKVNQQTNGGKWNLLGSKSLTAGSQTVKLSCWTTTGFVVIADAVKVVAK